MPWEISKKISLLAVTILFLFTFFNLIWDARKKAYTDKDKEEDKLFIDSA